YEPEATAHQPVYPLRATSGTDGRFRFTFTRSELDEKYLDASQPVVMAVADGFGLDWAEIGESAQDAALRLRLFRDVPVEGCILNEERKSVVGPITLPSGTIVAGRILNEERKPVVGAKVLVREVTRDPAARDYRSRSSKTCRGPLPGHLPQVTTAA